MTTRTHASVEVPEGVSFHYSCSLQKEDSAKLVAAQLDSLELTLYALDRERTIINGVDALNILNANLGTVDAEGRLTIVLRPEDTVILDAALPTEQRIMLIEGTYDGGTKATKHEVALTIRNLAKVPRAAVVGRRRAG